MALWVVEWCVDIGSILVPLTNNLPWSNSNISTSLPLRKISGNWYLDLSPVSTSSTAHGSMNIFKLRTLNSPASSPSGIYVHSAVGINLWSNSSIPVSNYPPIQLCPYVLVLPKFSSVRFSPHFLRTENRTDRIFSELNRTGIELVRTGSTCSVRFQNRFEQANQMILYVLI